MESDFNHYFLAHKLINPTNFHQGIKTNTTISSYSMFFSQCNSQHLWYTGLFQRKKIKALCTQSNDEYWV